MLLARIVHLATAVLWLAAALSMLPRARKLRRRRTRMRLYLLLLSGMAVSAHNLVLGLTVGQPLRLVHLAAIGLLSLVGALALYSGASYGDELLREERILSVLSRGHLGDEDGPAGRPAQPLSPRELQVLWLICLGLGNDEIATRLHLSRHTVVTHVRNLMRKLRVSSRVDAVSWALRTGVYDPSTGQVDAGRWWPATAAQLPGHAPPPKLPMVR